jgi:hypothetical protein
MFLGNRSNDNPATHGMWHSVWLGDRWSDLEPVIVGPAVVDGPLSSRFDPSRPRAIMSNGNLILLEWSTDPTAGRNGVWYTVTQLNTPEEAAMPLPTPEPIPTATPRFAMVGATQLQPTQSPLLAQFRNTPTNVEIPNPMKVLASAFVTATAICGMAVVIVRRRLFSKH